MRRLKWLVAIGLALLGGLRCETPSSPGTGPESNTLPELIVSDSRAPAGVDAVAGARIALPVAYVSLPPGTLAGVVSVRFRNLTAGGAATAPVPVVDGGFDPVAVPASAGDRLELGFTDGGGRVAVEYATVPITRTPVVVRTSPPRGRTDVALSVRPVVVFSEPIDPATLPVGMRLVTGQVLVSGRVELVEPWLAEFVPTSALKPATGYELEISRDVHDLLGTALETPLTVTFTTQSAAEPFGPSIAFVRSSPPGPAGTPGPPSIYVARADGSRVTRLTSGESPDWSPDGRSIAFLRGAEIRLINSDGSGERLLAYGGYGSEPAWSPDGTKIVFAIWNTLGTKGDLYLQNVTSPVVPTPLLGNGSAGGGDALFPAWPRWSPDGRTISFLRLGDWETVPRQIYVVNADGSDPRPLEFHPPPCSEVDGCQFFLGPPSEHHAWSPDGSRIAASVPAAYPADGRSPWALITADVSGADVRIHYEDATESGVRSYLGHPAWSPDGRSLAFEKYLLAGGCEPPSCPMRILVISVGDGAVRQLIPEAETAEGPDYWDYQPAWSRTGD